MILLKLFSLFTSNRIWMVILLTLLVFRNIAQTIDSTQKVPSYFGTAISVTNNGISLLPSFTLGKPALIVELVLGKGKLSFEPQLRFALEGKPWSFVFWGRYKLIKSNKFFMNVGTHPAVAFKTVKITNNGSTQEMQVAQRYWAAEFAPTFVTGKHSNVGLYYLTSHGFEQDATQYTHFVSLRSSFNQLSLSKDWRLSVAPQLYYLKMDATDAVAFSSSFTLSKDHYPLSLSSVINKTIQTTIPGMKDFIWNVSLIYSFNKKYLSTR